MKKHNMSPEDYATCHQQIERMAQSAIEADFGLGANMLLKRLVASQQKWDMKNKAKYDSMA